MKIKVGVSLRGVKWQLFYASVLAEGVLMSLGYGEIIITSGSEGNHLFDTHKDGWAVDWRNRHIPVDRREAVAVAIKERIGPEYNVVNEITPDPHFHCEYDPRAKLGKGVIT